METSMMKTVFFAMGLVSSSNKKVYIADVVEQIGMKNVNTSVVVEAITGLVKLGLVKAYTDGYKINVGKRLISTSEKVTKTGETKPKKMSGYNFFCQDKDVIALVNDEISTESGESTNSQRLKIFGRLWRDLEKDEKERYTKMAKDYKEQNTPPKVKKMSGYNFFCQDKDVIALVNDEISTESGESTNSQRLKIFGRLWHDLEKDEKERYTKMAKDYKEQNTPTSTTPPTKGGRCTKLAKKDSDLCGTHENAKDVQKEDSEDVQKEEDGAKKGRRCTKSKKECEDVVECDAQDTERRTRTVKKTVMHSEDGEEDDDAQEEDGDAQDSEDGEEDDDAQEEDGDAQDSEDGEEDDDAQDTDKDSDDSENGEEDDDAQDSEDGEEDDDAQDSEDGEEDDDAQDTDKDSDDSEDGEEDGDAQDTDKDDSEDGDAQE